MGSVRKYFRREFQCSILKLQHIDASNFYLSSFQKNRRALPLLCVRTVVFLGCLATVVASMTLTAMSLSFGHWFIYMTHWGLVMNLVASGLAFVVSYSAYTKGVIDATFDLPYYIKVFWVMYSVAVPIAFFITVYYYIFLLSEYGEDFSVDPVLDVFIHAINSALMLLLMLTSRHPSHLLHFVYPLTFGIVYLSFTVIYFFAGGTDPFGNAFIYPTLDWAKPVEAIISVIVSAIAIIVAHLLVVGIALGRNALSRRFKGTSHSITGSMAR